MVDVGSSLARADASQHSESQDMSTSMKKAVITSMDTIADSFDRNSLLLGFSTGQGTLNACFVLIYMAR